MSTDVAVLRPLHGACDAWMPQMAKPAAEPPADTAADRRSASVLGPPRFLDSRIVVQNGCATLYEIWWSGAHPSRGRVVENGFTGIETVELKLHVRPLKTFLVLPGKTE
ncbi:MAG: hypothetical protein G01um1014106_222 [Parcubacteria group bacterium Gr01-1014_106]|nr:MAG: hypothetical protein G01um1014106_222 [Parcubacteria group bacterium Gr01-1014_106]